MGRMGIALFGLGRAGMIHFHNAIKNHRIAIRWIVDLDVKRAKEVIESCNLDQTRVIGPDSAQLVYQDPDVEAVLVCTPTYTHEEVVRTALKHGKAVFCEKPIAEDAESTRACYDQAEAAGKPLLCSFNRRFDPSVRAVAERVKKGEVGKVHIIKSSSRDSPFPPLDYLRISGGIFHDCAVHDIDMICWIAGEYPCSVYAQAYAHCKEVGEMDDVDTVALVMTFPSGVLSTTDLSRHSSYGYDQRVEVHGSEGMVISENHAPTGVKQYNKAGVTGDCLKHSFPQRYADSYILALEHFVDTVQGSAEMEVSKSNTLKVSMIASACEESYRSQRPISLKLDALDLKPARPPKSPMDTNNIAAQSCDPHEAGIENGQNDNLVQAAV